MFIPCIAAAGKPGPYGVEPGQSIAARNRNLSVRPEGVRATSVECDLTRLNSGRAGGSGTDQGRPNVEKENDDVTIKNVAHDATTVRARYTGKQASAPGQLPGPPPIDEPHST